MKRDGQEKLEIVPLDMEEANEFVRRFHRHHKPLSLQKFAVGVATPDGQVRGAAIVGRPCARLSDNGWTLEVRRLATDGTPNACSALYGACWRASKALGYKKLITYILNTEPGTTLKASGWRLVGVRGGGTWDRPNSGRPRVDTHPTQKKLLYEIGD